MTHSGLQDDAPLRGVRVVDVSRHMAAPYGTSILGDFGADVVKVESVPRGDPARQIGAAFVDGEAALFLLWNRNKRSVAIDLARPEGLEVCRRLIAASDVFVESYRPGVAEEIGIGYEDVRAVNERIVYCSLNAFGSTGPLARYPATDPVIQAMSGVMSVTGEPDGGPLLVGVPVGDYAGSMALVQAILLALIARERTGHGQRVEVPMLGCLVFALSTRLASYWADGTDSKRFGSAHSVVVPYQAFRTADGDVIAGVWAPDAWPRFCRAMDMPELIDDPRYATNKDRLANRDDLITTFQDAFVLHPTSYWEERFHRELAMFAEICTVSQAVSHPQFATLGMERHVHHSTLGDIPQLVSPLLMSETPPELYLPPPVYGEHTHEVLGEIGFAPEELEALEADGIVRQSLVEGRRA